jgi:imidazoleglycerol phosphate dehydratase HisB
MSAKRIASVNRKTTETSISLEINLDGTGKFEIDTGVGFLDHMLVLLARHSLVDCKIKCTGDIEVDYHHTVEDLGLALGTAIDQALGDRKGIRRYGFFLLPMDESLAQVALDLGGRPFCVYSNDVKSTFVRDFDTNLFKEFFRALCVNARMNLHIKVDSEEAHHAAEAIFKAFARAFRQALECDPRDGGIPSTKGII